MFMILTLCLCAFASYNNDNESKRNLYVPKYNSYGRACLPVKFYSEKEIMSISKSNAKASQNPKNTGFNNKNTPHYTKDGSDSKKEEYNNARSNTNHDKSRFDALLKVAALSIKR